MYYLLSEDLPVEDSFLAGDESDLGSGFVSALDFFVSVLDSLVSDFDSLDSGFEDDEVLPVELDFV